MLSLEVTVVDERGIVVLTADVLPRGIGICPRRSRSGNRNGRSRGNEWVGSSMTRVGKEVGRSCVVAGSPDQQNGINGSGTNDRGRDEETVKSQSKESQKRDKRLGRIKREGGGEHETKRKTRQG